MTRPRNHVLVGLVVITACIAAVPVLSAKHDDVVFEKAKSLAKQEAKEATRTEFATQVQDKVAAEVQDQLDERLLPNPDTSLPTHLEPIEPVGPTTTTTEPEPFNLTTTTLPEETTTTTTIIEVPTTVTTPDPPLDP